MNRPREMRWLLNRLIGLNMLIDYSLHQKYGQTVMLAGVTYSRRPHIMNLGTAKAAVLAAEREYWWG